MLIKAIFIIFLIFSPKIRVCGLFDGAEYSRIYGIYFLLELIEWKGFQIPRMSQYPHLVPYKYQCSKIEFIQL